MSKLLSSIYLWFRCWKRRILVRFFGGIRYPVVCRQKPHGWFEDGVISVMLYKDFMGGYWNYSWGILSSDVPIKSYTYKGRSYEYIDRLGGQSWKRLKGENMIFFCKYATTLEEWNKNNIGPNVALV